MQILHTGDIVRARGRTWRVIDVRVFDGCRGISLTGTGTNAGSSCELLTPFDRIAPLPAPSSIPRRVSTGRWRRAARALIGRSGISGLLRRAADARLDILPHQLEPAIAVLRGSGCRVLLADEVGLGKTIEACLIIAELRARAVADRVLILTPPGLREQWKRELADRFTIDAAIVDGRAVRNRAGDMPPDVNVWATWPTAIASIDYVKRPEVLRAILSCRWDLIVIDEAHRVANDGDRRDAASALASRSGYVILMTATPHSGDDAAFRALCGLGAHEDRLLIFRRTRDVVAVSTDRHIHRLHVRPTADERRMHAKLEAFARAVRTERGDADRDMWIALALLRKRACSSARALQLSVTRRLDSLAGVASSLTQMRLPLDDEGELSADDDAPEWRDVLGLRDVNLERRLLTALADAATACAAQESKIAVVRRILRRVREPLIVFTEYRDTLMHLAREIGEPSVLLHGGLLAAERRSALAAFSGGQARVLLATDAAAEGLNLHHSCRAVVNLELPWNPMRLEQRIGRVDRIGQTRTVHAFHLIGRGTGEVELLDELRRRIAHAQSAVGAPDPLDGALGTPGEVAIVSDREDISEELRRLHLCRAMGTSNAEPGRPLFVTAANSHTRRRLSGRRLLIWESLIEDAREQPVASLVVAATCHETGADEEAVRSIFKPWADAAAGTHRAFGQAALTRSLSIARAIAGDRHSPLQPGLFDARAHFADAALQAARQAGIDAHESRVCDLRLAADISARPPLLRLVLEPS